MISILSVRGCRGLLARFSVSVVAMIHWVTLFFAKT